MQNENNGLETIAGGELNKAQAQGNLERLLRECASKEDFVDKCRKAFDVDPQFIEAAWGTKLRISTVFLGGGHKISAKYRMP